MVGEVEAALGDGNLVEWLFVEEPAEKVVVFASAFKIASRSGSFESTVPRFTGPTVGWCEKRLTSLPDAVSMRISWSQPLREGSLRTP